MKKFLLGAAFVAMTATSAQAATLIIDVSDIYSYDEEGSFLNELFSYDIGADSYVTGIAFDVSLYADAPSWLSEMVVSFTNTAYTTGVNLTPGVGNNFSGSASYSGSAYLPDYGLDFSVDSDGLLWVEFFETYDDYFEDWDGVWESGTITITYELTGTPPGGVPEPATWAMLIAGFGMVGLASRRRTRSVAA